jgi:hypothetical protein
VSGREGEETGVDGVHAKVAHHLERDGEEPDTVAAYDGTDLCRGIGTSGRDGDRRSCAKSVRRLRTGESANTRFDS